MYDEEHFLEGRSIEPKVGICENGEWKILAADHSHTSGGVIVGPDALPYEIELCAQLLEGKHIGPDDPPVIVCPATMQVYHTAFRKGWAQTIVNAGGSVCDVAMGRKMARLPVSQCLQTSVLTTTDLNRFASASTTLTSRA
jgi:homoaconitase/3-isopropylmalate dehydratase large subunit